MEMSRRGNRNWPKTDFFDQNVMVTQIDWASPRPENKVFKNPEAESNNGEQVNIEHQTTLNIEHFC